MCQEQPQVAASRILIPWDGMPPLDQVLILARSIGGADASLLLLPTSSGSATQNTTEAILRVGQPDQCVPHTDVEVLDAPDIVDLTIQIATVAAKREIDLILVATLCHPVGKIDPSCLAAQLALDSPIPVMVIHVDGDNLVALPQSIMRLLIPLDGSSRATQILPVAANLAHQLHLPVRFVMVIDPARILPPAYAYDPGASAEMVAGLTHEAHWALTQAEQFLSRQGITVSSDLLYGPVISSLNAAVEPGDVLAMTTHGIGAAPRARLGSVAATLVSNPPGPLVIMRSSVPPDIVVHHSEQLPARFS